MRANVIRTSDPDLAYRLSSGVQQTQEALNYFKEGYGNFVNRATQLGQDFVTSVGNMFNYYNNSNVLQNTKELLTDAGIITGEDVVYMLNEQTIHNPGYLMRRYVMSEPTLFNKYENNRCSGYDDEWFNPEPTETNPLMRDDYLYATEGLIQYDKNDQAFTTYTSTEIDNPLSIRDRLIVQDAWELVKQKMVTGMDPSDPEMGELG